MPWEWIKRLAGSPGSAIATSIRRELSPFLESNTEREIDESVASAVARVNAGTSLAAALQLAAGELLDKATHRAFWSGLRRSASELDLGPIPEAVYETATASIYAALSAGIAGEDAVMAGVELLRQHSAEHRPALRVDLLQGVVGMSGEWLDRDWPVDFAHLIDSFFARTPQAIALPLIAGLSASAKRLLAEMAKTPNAVEWLADQPLGWTNGLDVGVARRISMEFLIDPVERPVQWEVKLRLPSESGVDPWSIGAIGLSRYCASRFDAGSGWLKLQLLMLFVSQNAAYRHLGLPTAKTRGRVAELAVATTASELRSMQRH